MSQKKITKKKQRNKKTGQTRVIEKIENDLSFFCFFDSLDMKQIEETEDDEEA